MQHGVLSGILATRKMQEFDETVELMGENFYSYGINDNRKALESVCRYVHQQGLAKRQPTIEELFVESTLEFEEKQSG